MWLVFAWSFLVNFMQSCSYMTSPFGPLMTLPLFNYCSQLTNNNKIHFTVSTQVNLPSVLLPSVLWCCWLGSRKGIWPVKIMDWWGAGMFICLEQGASDWLMVQLMPLQPRHLLLQQNPEWFILLVPAYPGCQLVMEKRPSNGCVCVCVCVHRSACISEHTQLKLMHFVRAVAVCTALQMATSSCKLERS